MKLREYLDILNKMAKKNPKILDMEAFYSIDDEGNNYKNVFYTGSIIEHDTQDVFCIN